jgi:hypothetical protein
VVARTGIREQFGEDLVDERLEDDQAVANNGAVKFDDAGK